MGATEPYRICFVCLGNICRSPTAEGIMRTLVVHHGLEGVVEVDSAGTGGWHVGEPPDDRAVAESARRGIDISGLRGRQVHAGDFAFFDLLVAMDESNLADLADLAPDDEARARARRLREFDPASAGDDLDVPDPYYGGDDGFARVHELVTAACEGLLDHVRAELGDRA